MKYWKQPNEKICIGNIVYKKLSQLQDEWLELVSQTLYNVDVDSSIITALVTTDIMISTKKKTIVSPAKLWIDPPAAAGTCIEKTAAVR